MNIPIPGVPYQVASAGRAGQAPGVAPVQDASGEQMARFGGALMEGGAALSRRADYQQDLLDDAMTTELDNLTSDAISRVLYGTPDNPNAGYMNKTGREATGDARVAVETELDKEIEEIGKKATNEVQRQQWARMVRDRRRQASDQANRHAAAQTEVFLVGTTKARRDAARRDAARSDATPEQRASKKKLMVYATESLVKMAGGGEEQAAEEVLGQLTMLNETMIREVIDQDPQKARTLLDQAKANKEIDPERAVALDRLVQNGVDTEEAARLADDTLRTTGSLHAAEQHIMQLWRDGKIRSVEVRNKAIAQARDSANAAQTQIDTVNNRMVEEARIRFLTSGVIPPELETAIQNADLGWKLDAIREGGHTSEFGHNMLYGMSDEQWLMIPSEASVLALSSTMLSKDDQKIAVAKWNSAQERHGRAVAAARSEAAKREEAFAVQKEELARYYYGLHRGKPMESNEPGSEVAALTKYKTEFFPRVSMMTTGKTASHDDYEKAAADMRKEKVTIEEPILKSAAPEEFRRDFAALKRFQSKPGNTGVMPTLVQLEEERRKITKMEDYDEWARGLRSAATDQVYLDLRRNNLPASSITLDMVTDKMKSIVDKMSKLVGGIGVTNQERGRRQFDEQSRQSLNSKYVMAQAQAAQDRLEIHQDPRYNPDYNFAVATFETLGVMTPPPTREEFLIKLLVDNGKMHRDHYGLTVEEQTEMATRLVRGSK